MPHECFEALARELAARDRDLPEKLAAASAQAERLRETAEACIAAFRRAAREQGAGYLAGIEVGPVEPDEKHVDCLQFRIKRGCWALVCVAKAKGRVTIVGPFKTGKPEEPCADHPLGSAESEAALEDLLLALIRVASER